MKKYIYLLFFLYSAAATFAAWWGMGRNAEVKRLTGNQTVLCDSLHRYRTRLGEAAASVAALELRCDELRHLRAADAQRLRDLGIRLRRAESLSSAAVQMQAEVHAAVRDTIVSSGSMIFDSLPSDSLPSGSLPSGSLPAVRDTVRHFIWGDGWVTVEGCIRSDSLSCRVTSIDTLRQYVHRVPHRFLFFRWGTKAIRQEIVSSNPHTHIVWAEYIELSSRRRK